MKTIEISLQSAEIILAILAGKDVPPQFHVRLFADLAQKISDLQKETPPCTDAKPPQP